MPLNGHCFYHSKDGTYWGTLGQFVSSHHLDVEVLALRLPSRFDEPVEDLCVCVCVCVRETKWHLNKMMRKDINILCMCVCLRTHLWRGHLHVDDDGGQGGLEELGRVVDRVGVQHYQLEGLSQLKDPLYLTLDLS